MSIEVTGIEARGHVMDPRTQAAVWRFGERMIGHTIEFQVVFEAEGEDTRSRVEAFLTYPQKDGARGEVQTSVMVALGRVAFSFVYEAPGDLTITLVHKGAPFFEDTIPLEA
ncbi:MAG: hypothetical protein AB7P33_19475 [Dehalococcoidia bacterium]